MKLDEAKADFVRHIAQNERRMYGYILSLVPNWNDADEILQETHVRLWEEFDKFIPGTNFSAWAMKVAYFQVLTWRKRVGRDRHVYFDQDFLDVVSNEYISGMQDLDARYTALQICTESLSKNSRDLLSKCYANGARIKQVAMSLNRSAEAVYKSLQRVRSALRQCIERRLAEEVSL